MESRPSTHHDTAPVGGEHDARDDDGPPARRGALGDHECGGVRWVTLPREQGADGLVEVAFDGPVGRSQPCRAPRGGVRPCPAGHAARGRCRGPSPTASRGVRRPRPTRGPRPSGRRAPPAPAGSRRSRTSTSAPTTTSPAERLVVHVARAIVACRAGHPCDRSGLRVPGRPPRPALTVRSVALGELARAAVVERFAPSTVHRLQGVRRDLAGRVVVQGDEQRDRLEVGPAHGHEVAEVVLGREAHPSSVAPVRRDAQRSP